MKDKRNYKLLLIPIISSALLTILLIYLFAKTTTFDDYLKTWINLNNTFNPEVLLYLWVVFLTTISVLSIASMRLKKLAISFIMYLLFMIVNIFFVIILPKEINIYMCISVFLIIYSLGMLILEFIINNQNK